MEIPPQPTEVWRDHEVWTIGNAYVRLEYRDVSVPLVEVAEEGVYTFSGRKNELTFLGKHCLGGGVKLNSPYPLDDYGGGIKWREDN